jgi:hypothetical protein
MALKERTADAVSDLMSQGAAAQEALSARHAKDKAAALQRCSDDATAALQRCVERSTRVLRVVLRVMLAAAVLTREGCASACGDDRLSVRVCVWEGGGVATCFR